MDTTASPEQRAIDKSRALDSDLMRTSRVAAGRYQVLGNSAWYEIAVSASGYSCTCKGAEFGERCWHVGSVYRMRLACRSLKPAQAALTPGQQAKKDLWG